MLIDVDHVVRISDLSGVKFSETRLDVFVLPLHFIKMDALNHMRQRQLRDVVTFFLEDSKNDPAPVEAADKSSGGSSKSRAGEGKQR